MFTIRVITESDGKPAEDRRVSVGFDGWFRGFTSDKFTNERGEVHFDEENGYGTIYVDHENVYKGEIAGRMVVYV